MKGRYLLLLLLFANFGVMVVGQVEPERDVSEVPIHDKAVSDYDFLVRPMTFQCNVFIGYSNFSFLF